MQTFALAKTVRFVAIVVATVICAPPLATTAQAQTGGVYYRYCANARAAGAAPIRRGQPGYGAHLDRDGDGIACEVYRPGRSSAATTRRRRRR